MFTTFSQAVNCSSSAGTPMQWVSQLSKIYRMTDVETGHQAICVGRFRVRKQKLPMGPMAWAAAAVVQRCFDRPSVMSTMKSTAALMRSAAMLQATSSHVGSLQLALQRCLVCRAPRAFSGKADDDQGDPLSWIPLHVQLSIHPGPRSSVVSQVSSFCR